MTLEVKVMDPLRIFISSPGDVADERELARKLIEETLRRDPSFHDRVLLRAVTWNDPYAPTPILAQLTPQEAVNRHLPKPSECEIVVVILWARMGTPLPAEIRKPDGKPYASGTEWEYEDALQGDPQPDILVYRRTEPPRISLEDPDDPDIQDAIEQRRQVKNFLARFRNADGSLAGGTTEYDTPSLFVERLESNLRHLIERRLQDQTPAAAKTIGKAITEQRNPDWTGSPYPGLRPFTTEEAPIFFGRGREEDALISRLRDPAQRFLAIVGASGSGKSSLVYAGLLPRLAAGAIEGSQHWRVVAFTPGASGDNPLLSLASELKGMLPMQIQRPQIEIAMALAKSSRLPAEYIDALLAGRPTSAVVMLFIDQFEELFTQAAEGYRRDFINFLTQATAGPRVWVLATVRADFLPRCAAEPGLAVLLQSGSFVMGAPGPIALADMVRKPAEQAGLDIEAALVDKILIDAGGEPGEALPLVAFCLKELYEQTAPERRLTLGSYQAIGGLRGAISRRTGAVLKEFEEAEGEALEKALPQLFRALVHIDAAGKEARQRAFRDELAKVPAPIPKLIEQLIKERLLQAGEADGRATVTLVHEALIQEWPALKQWLANNRGRVQRIQRLLLNMVSPDAKDREYAIAQIAKMGSAKRDPAMREVVSALLPLLGNPNKNARESAIIVLGNIGPAAAEAVPEVVPALTALLNDAQGGVRANAASALGNIGPAATEAVPALVVALGDVGNVRASAASALGNIGPAAAEAVPEVVPALAALLSDPKGGVRANAASALGRIGPAAAEAVPEIVPTLAALLNEAHGGVRANAASALGRIGPTVAKVVPALVDALINAERGVRANAASALGRIGRAAVEAVPEVVPMLITALGDSDGSVRSGAAKALSRLGREVPDIITALNTALCSANENVRSGAAEALSQLRVSAT